MLAAGGTGLQRLGLRQALALCRAGGCAPAPPPAWGGEGRRGYADGDVDITFDASYGRLEEVLDKTMKKGQKRNMKQGEEIIQPRAVLTTRHEALSLYREVLRTSILFVWRNERGVPFKDIIRESARKEFEAARYESDPEMINRLIVTGRDCVDKAVGKFMKERERIIAEENAPHNDPNRRPTTY